MSAIAGIYNIYKKPIEVEQCQIILDSLSIFSVDNIGSWQTDFLFLTCFAQWITPESRDEKLPNYNSETQVCITADAIIDNRDELFDLLNIKKNLREIIPDSELILLAYLKWGEHSPKYLVGDFAYMIWDEKEQKLFGARDFSGSRTLYYVLNKEFFAFCTVMEPLLNLRKVTRTINEEWIAQYLAITSMIDVVDSNSSIYKDIFEIPPSHSITVKNGVIKLNRYSQLEPGIKLLLNSDDQYVEAFQDIFKKAVDSRLRTHHNVGAQLSGGLDSGSITSFAANTLGTNKTLNAFSYIPPSGFEDFTPNNILPNESSHISLTVNYIKTLDHQFLPFENRNSYSEIDTFLKTMEMPYKFFENSFWIKGMFEKAAEKNVGVLLNGGRGNLSISWGSAMDYYGSLLKRLKFIQLYSELDHYSRKIGGARLRRLPIITKIAFPQLNYFNKSNNPYDFPVIVNSELAKKYNVYQKLKEHGIYEGTNSTKDIFTQRQEHFRELFHWNASNTVATKLSLKYKLWKRDPSNDIRVIKFCLSLPEEQYVNQGMDRALIRRATKGYLPDEIRLNQTKRGVQGADWVYRMAPVWPQFVEEVDQLRSDKDMKYIFNMSTIESAREKIINGPKAKFAVDPLYKTIMRAIVVKRFLKNYS